MILGPIALLLAATAAPTGHGMAASVQLTAGAVQLDTTGKVQVLEDRGGQLDIEQVTRPPSADRFQDELPRGPQGGLLSVFWLRFTLENTTSERAEWQLDYEFPLVDELDLYELDHGIWTHRRGGLAVPVASRTIIHGGSSHSAGVRLEPGERRLCLLRVATRAYLLVPPTLWSQEAAAQRRTLVALGFGIGLGILALLAVLQIYAAVHLRLRLGLAGGAFLAAIAMVMLTFSGLGPVCIFPSAGGWWLSAGSFFGSLALAVGALFTRSFLVAKERDRLMDRGLLAMAAFGCATALLTPFARSAAGAMTTLLLTPAFILFSAASIRAVLRGDDGSQAFLAAAIVTVVFGSGMALSVLGLLRPHVLAPLALQLGFVLAGAILTVALADRAVIANDRARQFLEEEVAGRTRALDEAVRQLRSEVDDRRRALDALRESEERFRVAFDTSPDSIAINRAHDGVFLAVNRGFTEMTGWTLSEIAGRSSGEIGLWVDDADRERLYHKLQWGNAVLNLEARFRLKNGQVRASLISAQLIHLQGQTYCLTVTRDVTEMKEAEAERNRLQDQLRQAQKMEAIGRLAGGVAHDFNNLLTVIGTNAGLSLEELPADDPSRASFQEIQDAARRAGALTRQLLAFGRRQVIEPRPLDLSAHVEGMNNMLRRLLGEDIELSLSLDRELFQVMVDGSQVEQVLVNLTVNARDALPQGGRIIVSTLSVTVEPSESTPDRPAGRYGVLSVRDTGAGIPSEVQAHIFEPFFTTKRQGTGLGLSTVYGIARQHGGFVEVETEPGAGSAFRVFFPAAASEQPRHKEPAPAPESAGGNETVIVVEDEAPVRDATRSVLERLGYQVLVAHDGRHALEVSDLHAGPIHLLVSDVVMPRMNGRDLARAISLRRPGLPVLFVSGYSEDVISRCGLLESGISLLQKPFEPHELARAVRRLLDGAPVAS